MGHIGIYYGKYPVYFWQIKNNGIKMFLLGFLSSFVAFLEEMNALLTHYMILFV